MKQLYLLITALLSIAFNANTQIINTIAGGYYGDGAKVTSIGIAPQNLVVDAAGNIFIAEPEKHIVKKISVNGVFTVVAGNGISGFSGDGGPATSAQLKNPYNIAIDSAGDLFIADGYDNRIRKVAMNGIITTIAGNGTLGFSGDGGPATSAQLNGPNALAADNAGNVYIADFGNDRVRKVDANGIITTIAGDGIFGSTGDGGPAALARFGNPIGVCINKGGEVFISDLGFSKIRKIDSHGIITTIAGSGYGTGGFSGDGGPATSAQLNQVAGSVAIDASGNIFIPDTYNYRIRKVDANGIITTVVGNGTQGFSGDSSLATTAAISFITGVAVDASGNIFIPANVRVREVTTNGIINTIAGNGSGGFNGDGILAASAELFGIGGVVTDAAGNVFFSSDNRVRKINTTGIITTVAGGGTTVGDSGLATSALIAPEYVAIGTAGNIFFSEIGLIRKVDKNGIISTIAGNGSHGFGGDGGSATAAQFNVIGGIAVDKSGNIYIADRYNFRIRKITLHGIINTVAGNGTEGSSGDGGPALAAQFGIINNLTADSAGNIFIADGENYQVRKIDTDGVINTIAGNGSAGFSGDNGPATSAQLDFPIAVAVDVSGNIYVADYYNDRIRKVTSSGIISTIAGGGTVYGDGGIATNADIPGITALAMDATGNIFIGDGLNYRLREITGRSLPLTLLQFTAQQNKNNITTIWQTAYEINTAKFEIQRSTDGFNFTTIGTVEATGNNNIRSENYSYTDANILQLNTNALFYRLQIIDKDGKKALSKIVKITLITSDFEFSLSPNPTSTIVYIKGYNIKQISISDNAGKILVTAKVSSNQTPLNISGLAKGIYTVKVYFTNGISETKKLVVQ